MIPELGENYGAGTIIGIEIRSREPTRIWRKGGTGYGHLWQQCWWMSCN